MKKLIVTFDSHEWDEIQKRIIGNKRKRQSNYFTQLLNIKLQHFGVNCHLKRKYKC